MLKKAIITTTLFFLMVFFNSVFTTTVFASWVIPGNDYCSPICFEVANSGNDPCVMSVCQGCSICKGFFGKIALPSGVAEYGDFGTGLVKFLNNILKLLIVGAGLFAFFNIIIAGYSFLGAGGDPKKIEQAWARIWQSLLGLLFVAGAFVLAAIFGILLFGDPSAIISPKIYGPN